ncbi:MAG: acylphosphatase [Spirochaetes bacterium]|nr:acylphosphatase [Spirochaetota bacterium]
MTESLSKKKSCRIVVSGRVQGVGFRYSAVRAAEKYRVLGWVRNNFDGSVEIDCEGDAKNIDSFVKWLKVGPAGARVFSVEVREKQYQGVYSNFGIEH